MKAEKGFIVGMRIRIRNPEPHENRNKEPETQGDRPLGNSIGAL